MRGGQDQASRPERERPRLQALALCHTRPAAGRHRYILTCPHQHRARFHFHSNPGVRPAEIALSLSLSPPLRRPSAARMIQVFTGHHEFTYDHVFGGPDGAEPDQLYPKCVAPLVDGLFRGYNATVFAYGQTGGVEGRHADEGGAACRRGLKCGVGHMHATCTHGCKHAVLQCCRQDMYAWGVVTRPCGAQKWTEGRAVQHSIASMHVAQALGPATH